MIYYIYKIIDINTNKFYIGARSSKVNPELDLGIKYFSSSTTIKKLIKSNGVASLKFEIMNSQYKSWKSAYHAEQKLINSEWDNPLLLNKSCYYMKKDFGVISNEAKRKISKSSKQMWTDINHRELMSIKQKNSWTPERKKHHSIFMKSLWTPERRKQHSDKISGHVGTTKCKGVPKPKGFGKKVSGRLKGKPKSDVHRQHISDAKTGVTRKVSAEIIKLLFSDFEMSLPYKTLISKYNLSHSTIYKIKKQWKVSRNA